MSPAAPPEQLGQGQRPDVLLHVDRAVEVRPESIEQRDVVEVGQQVVADDAALAQVQPARRGDADGEQTPAAGRPRGPPRRVNDDLQHRLPVQAGPQPDLLLRHHVAGEVGQHRADPQRLQVHAQEAAVSGVQPHRHRRAAPPRRARVVLHQQAVPEEFIDIVADRGRIDVEPPRQVEARARSARGRSRLRIRCLLAISFDSRGRCRWRMLMRSVFSNELPMGLACGRAASLVPGTSRSTGDYTK